MQTNYPQGASPVCPHCGRCPHCGMSQYSNQYQFVPYAGGLTPSGTTTTQSNAGSNTTGTNVAGIVPPTNTI